jgi:hypothetical protein
VQLRPPRPERAPDDLAAGLAALATELGQRPAVTVLGDAGRAEQGFVSLAQWAAKGAHLLLADVFLSPGDTVLVDVPPSWQLAAVCAAVWWAGGAVTTDPSRADDGAVVGVVHESRDAPAGVDPLYVVGDAPDGTTTGGSGGAARTALGSWAEEVQLFPDQPPPRAARPELVALRAGNGDRTHAGLVRAALAGPQGTLGLDLATWGGGDDDAVAAVAARPLATGRTTLVLRDGLGRAEAGGDRVRTWA